MGSGSLAKAGQTEEGAKNDAMKIF